MSSHNAPPHKWQTRLDVDIIYNFVLEGDLEKEKGKVSAKDCVMKIGSVHVKFKGGAR